LSPNLPVQGGIKRTYQKTLVLLPFHHLAEWVTPLPSIKLFYPTHPHVLLGLFHLECKDQDLLKIPFADNISGKLARGIRDMLSLLIVFILLPSSGSMPHHLIFHRKQNTTHSLGGMGPSGWDIHPKLRTHLEPQRRWAAP
jgi:hypothetical protein